MSNQAQCKEGARDVTNVLAGAVTFDNYSVYCDVIFQENLNGTTTFGASCQEYYERGSRRNGTYSIRPDLSRNEIQPIFIRGVLKMAQKDTEGDVVT